MTPTSKELEVSEYAVSQAHRDSKPLIHTLEWQFLRRQEIYTNQLAN